MNMSIMENKTHESIRAIKKNKKGNDMHKKKMEKAKKKNNTHEKIH